MQPLSRLERKAQTREQLIQAALRCFEARGFAATTLEEIAREAGVTTGAVYSNFGNKEELFLELIERFDPAPLDVSMLGDTSRPLVERFRSFGEANARDAEISAATMATWYEVRSFALRNERARAAAHDTVSQSMNAWGERVERLAPLMGAKAVVSGRSVALISQALLDGLRGLRAFLPEDVTAEVYGEAARLLAYLFEEREAN
jgi:AcrR family transcriptional regulator